MTDRAAETSPLALARGAGALALVILIAGTLEGAIHARLVVPGDAVATVDNILAAGSLFRIGVVSGLVMYTVDILYVLALYRLLASVDRNQAVLMAVLGLMGVPIAMLNQAHEAAVLSLLSGADYLKAMPADQIRAQVMLYLDVHGQGNLVAIVFWGLWLLPLGWLVYRSGFFPRLLGVLLMIGCFGWLAVFVQRLLFPDHEALASLRYAAYVAELSWLSWLLIRGVDVERWRRCALEPA